MVTIKKYILNPGCLLGILFAVVSFAIILNLPDEDETTSIWSPLIISQQTAHTPKGYDIVYVIDNSASMLRQDPEGMGRKAFEQITSLAMDYDVSIGVIFFDREAHISLDLTHLDSTETANTVTNAIISFEGETDRGETNISAGLEAAYYLLESGEANREKRIILFSDGINESYSHTMTNRYDANLQMIAEKLSSTNIVLYGLFKNLNRNLTSDSSAFKYFFSNQSEIDSHVMDISDENIEEYMSTIVNQFFAVLVDKADRLSLKSLLTVEPDDDESNLLSLYVPECGISRMEIFIEDINPNVIELTSLGCSKSFISPTGKTILYSYENPSPGIWTIGIKDKKILNEGKCSVSFIADINCRIQFTEKNGQYHSLFHFYDSQGNEIFMDDKISLSAQIKNENGGIIPIPDITNRKGVMYSDEFTITDDFKENGIIEFTLEYADYLEKDYSTEIPVWNHSITGISNKRYYGRKNSEGIVLSIPLQEICDSKGIRTIKLSEDNTKNMVAASLQDQNVEITVSKKGTFQGDLFLGDSTGIESVLSVKGTALTSTSIIMTVGVVSASLLLLLGTIIVLQRRQKLTGIQHG